MWRRVCAILVLVAAAGAGSNIEPLGTLDITDEQYYQMPKMFKLDRYEECAAISGLYCVGSFELLPPVHAGPNSTPALLYTVIKRYSAYWVDHYNHTRVHRGVCLQKGCAHTHTLHKDPLQRFGQCVNESIYDEYGLATLPMAGATCNEAGSVPESGRGDRAFAILLATLLAAAALSTTADLLLPDHTKKGYAWVNAWSIRAGWKRLAGSAQSGGVPALDGLRVWSLLIVICDHVTWLGMLTYNDDTRLVEKLRRDGDVMLLANSTVVVQIFFLLASFLLANKMLGEQKTGAASDAVGTFFSTMINRIVRILPTQMVMVLFVGTAWERLSSGPLWTPLVGREAAICRDKWWTHLLFINNIVKPDDKCLLQTWYLAADMQLYAISLTLILITRRWPRQRALWTLVALLVMTIVSQYLFILRWDIQPSFVLHRPDEILREYRGSKSFNLMYQAPCGNITGGLVGLLLAYTHHVLKDARVRLAEYKVVSILLGFAAPAAFAWVACTPMLLGGDSPGPLAQILAALERPVFALLVAAAVLAALHDIRTPVSEFLSWRGWAVLARLSFAAFLIHMPLNKGLVAARLTPTTLGRYNVVMEFFAVATASFVVAVPVTLLVEGPAIALWQAARAPRAPRTSHPTTPEKPQL